MSDVRWEGFTHEEIYERVMRGPGRAASADAEAAWSTVESTIRAVDDQLRRAVSQVGVDWQGAAADRVQGGMAVLSAWAGEAAGNALRTRDGITAQAEAAGHVRTAMPNPRTSELDAAINLGAASNGYVLRSDNAGSVEDGIVEARARAVNLMNEYGADSGANQERMSSGTAPPSVVVEGAAAGAGSGPAGAGSSVGAGPVGGAAGRTEQLGPATPGGLGPTTGSGPGGGPVVGGAGTGSAGGPAGVPPLGASPGRTGGATTGPGSPRVPGTDPRAGGVRPVVPGPPPRPGGVGAGTPVPGAPRAGGPPGPVPRPGVPGIGVSPEPPVRGGPGVGVGGPGGLHSRSAGGAAEAVAAGRGAPLGSHGFLPLGAGLAQPADQEHRRASYLVDDTDAFVDDRWFTPSVIGGDDPEVGSA